MLVIKPVINDFSETLFGPVLLFGPPHLLLNYGYSTAGSPTESKLTFPVNNAVATALVLQKCQYFPVFNTRNRKIPVLLRPTDQVALGPDLEMTTVLGTGREGP